MGQDIGGDVFVGIKKLRVAAKAAQHHVANDQQGPAIAEDFDGSVQGTPGAELGARMTSVHGESIIFSLAINK